MASQQIKGKGKALAGTFDLSTRQRNKVTPKHLLVRFTEGTLNDILNGKQSAALSFDENGVPVLRVGHTCHEIKADIETQAHEVYVNKAGSSRLEPIAYIGHRYAVKQEMDQAAQDRIRSRTEAAVAQRESRHIVVLDKEPTNRKGSRQQHGPSHLSRNSGVSTPGRSSSPIGSAPSPVTTPKPRQPSRLVAADSRPDRRLASVVASAPQVPTTTIQVSEGQQKCAKISPPARSPSGSSNESSNESAPPSLIFSNQSSTSSSMSSRTSVSSADSPPSKEGTLVTIAVEPAGLQLPQTQKQNTTPNVSPRTNSNIHAFSASQSKKPAFNSLKRKSDSGEAPATSNKKPRTSSTSASDTAGPSRPTKPQANGRTSGGTRYSKPKKAKADGLDMQRTTSASSSASSEVPLKAIAMSSKRKSVEADGPTPPKRKVRRVTPEFTSSEEEEKDEEPASNDIDAEGEDEDDSDVSPVSVVIDNASYGKPLRTAVTDLIAASGHSRVNTPPLASREASVEPGAQSAPAVKTFTIANPTQYKQHRMRFDFMFKEYERERNRVERMRNVISAIIKGDEVLDSERQGVWSHKEAQSAIADVMSRAANLQSLKNAIYAYANDHAGATS